MTAQSALPASYLVAARLAILRSSWKIIWRSVAVIFATEFTVMMVLRLLGLPISASSALLDSVLLSSVALPALYAVILRPVSELAAQQAALSAENRFQAVAHSVQDGIVTAGWDRKIRFANGALARMFGRTASELPGADITCLMGEQDGARCAKGMSRLQETGEAHMVGKGVVEVEGQRKNGTCFPLELSLSRLGQGEETTFIGVLRDVTERKRAEEVLRASERKFREVLENLPVGVRIIQGTRLIYANPTDARMFGFPSPGEEIGLDAFEQVAEEDRARLRGFAEDRQAGREAPRQYQANLRRREGSVFPAEVYATLIEYGGAPASLLAMSDLSEKNRLHLYEQLLPVCCVCGKIRDDTGVGRGKGSWGRLDQYVSRHSGSRLTHTYCPACLEKFRKEQGLPADDGREQE